MKEKIIRFLLILLTAVYLMTTIYHGHKKWQQGISLEEQIQAETIIW